MESTRRIVMFNWMTANGYFAGADGNLDWVVPDEEQAKAAAEGIPKFDTILFGRRTYELFEEFLGHAVVDDSGTVPDPHHPGRRSSEHGAMTIALNRMTKLVFSRTLRGRDVEEFPPAPRTRPARDRDHAEAVRQRHDCLW